MRDTFVRVLSKLAAKDKDVMLVTGDIGFGVLQNYWETYPNQFINAGIAEQNMTGIATGMALEGKVVFTYSIGNFPTMRCLEQIRNDAAYHNANVKIISVGGGFSYGPLGMSHHATEDLAIMRALPNVIVLAPGDIAEAEAAVQCLYEWEGTGYLRLGRGNGLIHNKPIGFELGKTIPITEGSSVAIFSTGEILDEANKAAIELNQIGISTGLYSFPTVKPIDIDMIRKVSQEVDTIVTVEEHNIVGGFGSAVAEVLAGVAGTRAQQVRIGLEDTYSEIVGSQEYLRDCYGMSSTKIVEKICNIYSGRYVSHET